jgi:hypothetical protein
MVEYIMVIECVASPSMDRMLRLSGLRVQLTDPNMRSNDGEQAHWIVIGPL